MLEDRYSTRIHRIEWSAFITFGVALNFEVRILGVSFC